MPESDHLTLLNVYQQWKLHNYSGEWCTKHYIHVKSLRKVREVRAQLKDIMEQQKVKLCSVPNSRYDLVRKAICSGYFTNAAKIKGIGEYVNLRTGIPCKMHPSSALFTLGYAPDYIVYHELIMTSKEYMHTVSTVDPYWLAEMGSMFFSIKEPFTDRELRREKEERDRKVMENEVEKKRILTEQISREDDSKASKLFKKQNTEIVQPGRSNTPLRTPKIHY